VLDAWRAIHDARYDAAAHGARNTREQLLAPGNPARLIAYTLKVEGVALYRQGRYAEAESLTRRAAELFEAAGEPVQMSQCATNLGLILNARGEHAAARTELRRAVLALEAADAAEERVALARVNLAVAELHLGGVEAARCLFEASLATFRRLNLVSEQITALNGIGHCARVLGRFEAALAQHRAALRLATPQLARQLGLCHEFIGRVLFERGERVAAESHYRRAAEIAAHIAPEGDLMLEVSWHQAELFVSDGRLDEAGELLDRAEALCEASAERRELGCVQRARARWLAARNDPRADEVFEMAVRTLEAAARPFEIVPTRIAQSEAALAAGRPARAQAVLGQARAILLERFPGSAWIDRVETLLTHFGAAPDRDAEPRWGFCTSDPEMLALLDDLPQLAATPFAVLIEGESGTGKELIAGALHAAAGRTGACVALNCAAIPRDLFESELFGHVRGAFSGATLDKPGLFEQADGGTLVLDEIGELPLEMQAKLLRVLDDGWVRRVGEARQRRVRVKVVACTNRELESAVAAGTFRNDLYHRLAVHTLHLKPLRERIGDIEPLARHLLRRDGLCDRLVVTDALVAELESQPWRGNARELRNWLVRAALQHRPAAIAVGARPGAGALRVTRSTHERRAIEAALAASGGNVGGAARSLRLHATTLRRKMRALGIERRG
jgi:transcriptional regulator with AAA-type ATPase domain